MGFYFRGQLPASKSILNRLQIVQLFASGMEIVGESRADDVVHLRQAIAAWRDGQIADCGSAGTAFRFLAVAASRFPGTHRLTGTSRLLSRPQDELLQILKQLGVQANWRGQELVIESRGWQPPPSPLQIPADRSSQFASGVLLSAWNLEFPLTFEFTGSTVSTAYWHMTRRLCAALGMQLEIQGTQVKLQSGQTVRGKRARAESDASSAFAVAAAAVLAGSAEILGFPESGMQPDVIFVLLLQEMGAWVTRTGDVLEVKKASHLRGLEVSLRDCPDLFPVLAVLCARADGVSKLADAAHLAFKESNRIAKTAELLRGLGCEVDVLPDGLVIQPSRQAWSQRPAFAFDCDQDHRLVMAAQVARLGGAQIDLRGEAALSKSFPEFAEILRVSGSNA